MTESMTFEGPVCAANKASPFHEASVRCCDKWWCSAHLGMHSKSPDHGRKERPTVKELADIHRKMWPEGCPSTYCDVCASVGLGKFKCAIEGCGWAQTKYSIYCEQHDRDAQGTNMEIKNEHECAIEGCHSMACNWASTSTVDEWRCFKHLHEVSRKDDSGKTRWDLIPWRGLKQVVDVLAFGAKKYAPDNWRKVDGWRWRYFRAGIGHMISWVGGEKLDPESGCHHLAHAVACCLFMLELDQ